MTLYHGSNVAVPKPKSRIDFWILVLDFTLQPIKCRPYFLLLLRLGRGYKNG